MSVTLWSEKYRPVKMADYVWRDAQLQSKAQEWINNGALPHLILSGKSGLGKTSLAKMLLMELGVPKHDILEINSSGNRKVDEVQDRILGFVSTYPEIDNIHGIKYVLMDEADSMSRIAQKFLRAEMERNVNSVRFIFTCNYKEKIEPAIISRCQLFHFEELSQEQFIERLVHVLTSEGVSYDIDTLVPYIDHAYPDLRKTIGMVQQHCVDGVLAPLRKDDGAGFDYIAEVAGLFQTNQHRKAREMIVNQATVDEYPEIFRFLYKNLELWGDEGNQDDALIIIRDGLYKHSIVSDAEINLAATICELSRLNR